MTKKYLSFWFYVLFLFSVIIIPIEIADHALKSEGYWTERYGTIEDKRNGREGKWCEATIAESDSFMREPINSRSNYGFILVGCYMVLAAIFDALCMIRNKTDSNKNNDTTGNDDDDGMKQTSENVVSVVKEEYGNIEEELQTEKKPAKVEKIEIRNGVFQYPIVSLTAGIANILLGLGSFYMHACNCSPGFRADNAGMLAVASFPVFMTPLQLAMGSLLPIRPSIQSYLRLFCSLLPPIGQSLMYVSKIRSWGIWKDTFIMLGPLDIIVSISVALLLSSSRLGERNNHQQQQRHSFDYYIIGVGVLATIIGGISWILDESKIWCFRTHAFPLNLLRGHAFCHILMAVVSFCTYYWYRSERIFLIVKDGSNSENNENNRKDENV